MRELIEWHDYICQVLREGLNRAEPTGSTIEPTAIVSFSRELIQTMLDKAPLRAANGK